MYVLFICGCLNVFSPSNNIAKMQHRYMFEMKFREKEQQQYWYQNQQMYYNNQQAAMANMMSTGMCKILSFRIV